VEKQLARIVEQEAAINAEIAEHAHDYERLAELSARLGVLLAEKEGVELEWLEAAEVLE
jgi:ATP-binding cassette subfamily F protein uup